MACGGGAGCPWVAGQLGANGRHGFDRCSLWVVKSPGLAGAGAAGSAPVREFGFVLFFSLLFYFQYVYK